MALKHEEDKDGGGCCREEVKEFIFFVVFCFSTFIKAPAPSRCQGKSASGVGFGQRFVTPVPARKLAGAS